MKILKYGLTIFVGLYLIYNLVTVGITPLTSLVFIFYILSIMGEVAIYYKRKREAEDIGAQEKDLGWEEKASQKRQEDNR